MSEGGVPQAARGQARIPSIEILEQLVGQAKKEGWGDYDGDGIGSPIAAAADRLRKAGAVVDTVSGDVGWPNKEAAGQANLTDQIVEDGRPNDT